MVSRESLIFLSILLLKLGFCNGSEEGLKNFFDRMQQIDVYLEKVHPMSYEGHIRQAKMEYFYHLLQKSPEVKLIAEIGFNSGHSSETFLQAREDVKVVAFDIGLYPVVQVAKEYIDDTHPGRHMLVLGDSTKTVLEFQSQHPDVKFDLIFIDGGHLYDICMKDIRNMKELAHPDTIIVMDDLAPQYDFGKGPTLAWANAKKQGFIQQDQLFYSPNTRETWVQGKYLFSHEQSATQPNE